MFLDCSGRSQHKSISGAIDLLLNDIEMMHSKGGNGKFNLPMIMKRLQGLCQNGTSFFSMPASMHIMLHVECDVIDAQVDREMFPSAEKARGVTLY